MIESALGSRYSSVTWQRSHEQITLTGFDGNPHQEVVVLHAEGELLHVDVVDGAVGRAKKEEGAGSVVRRDRGQFL